MTIYATLTGAGTPVIGELHAPHLTDSGEIRGAISHG